MRSKGFTDIIKKSPFGPIQAHMEVSKLSVEELIIFLKAAINSNWEQATQSRETISNLVCGKFWINLSSIS